LEIASGEFSSEFKVKAAFAANFGERVSRGFGIEFGDGGERITVEDGSVQNLDGTAERNCVPPRCRFAANASANGLQTFAAGWAEAIDKVEGDLRVEDGLTGRLEGEGVAWFANSSSSMPWRPASETVRKKIRER